MNKVIIIICSTPFSKRVPEKCFLKINGKTALMHILDRIKSLNMKTVIAIPDNTYKEYICKTGHVDIISLYGGNKESPLHRMADLLKEEKSDYVIRITHDDIIIDSQTVTELLAEVIKQKAGYGITPTIIEGAGVEIIATENILQAAEKHKENVEHISYFVKGEGCPNPRIVKLRPRKSIERNYRITLDYYEDYVVLETIFRKLGNNASVDDICEFLDMNPAILNYNKLPDITLYTCVRNGEKWIKKAMRNIPSLGNFSPLGFDYEYIIIDDDSKDNTLYWILEDNRINYRVIVNQKNLGLASSSNIAISQAKGKYIMRIDCDDLIKPNTIETMREEMKRTGAVICYANYDEINENGDIIRRNVDAKENYHIGCALVNKRFLNEIRFKEGIKHWDGLELYNRIKNKFPIVYYDKALWYYRIHKNSLSRTNLKEREKNKPIINND